MRVHLNHILPPLLVAVLVLLLVQSSIGLASPSISLWGSISILHTSSVESTPRHRDVSYVLEQSSGKLTEIQFPDYYPPPSWLQTGISVVVIGTLSTDSNELLVQSVTQDLQQEAVTGTNTVAAATNPAAAVSPAVLRPAVFLLKLCNDNATATTAAAVSTAFTTSLAPLMRSCSFNKMEVQVDAAAIFPDVPIPCEGKTPSGNNYDLSCDSIDLYAWAELATAHVAQHYPTFNLAPYKQRIYILSGSADYSCAAGGFSEQGCAGSTKASCPLWVTYNSALDPQYMVYMTMHELGHTMGLHHAVKVTPDGYDEYGDLSTPMGFSRYGMCYNGPQQLQLSWSSAVAAISLQAMKSAQVYTISLPALHTTPTSLLSITLPRSTPTSPQYTLTFTYLTPNGPMVRLQKSYASSVNIYLVNSNGTTQHIDAVPPSSIWIDYNLLLQMSPIASSPQPAAQLLICRFQTDPSTCDLNATPLSLTTLIPKLSPKPRPKPSPKPRPKPSPKPSPKSKPPSPKRKSPSPKHKSPSPKRKSPSPKRKSPSPKHKSPSPKRKSPKPKHKSPSPKRKSPSPKRKSPSPKRKSPSPKHKSPSPKRTSSTKPSPRPSPKPTG